MSVSKSILNAGVLALATAGGVSAQEVNVQTSGARAFDAATVVFVAASKAGTVYAFDLSEVLTDQSEYQLGRAQTLEGRTIFNTLDVEIAALLTEGSGKFCHQQRGAIPRFPSPLTASWTAARHSDC